MPKYSLRKVKVWDYRIIKDRKIVAFIYRGTGRIWYMIANTEPRHVEGDKFKSAKEAFEYYLDRYRG